jgi:DNA-binding transcriptional ArsR family regulator
MRNLIHPSIEDVTVEAVLHALADPVRVTIFEQIAGSSSPQTCSDFLTVCAQKVPKSTLSQHFKVLREAGLIRSERHGVEMRSTSRCPEIEQRFPGLIPSIIKALKIQARHGTALRRGAARGRRPAETGG